MSQNDLTPDTYPETYGLPIQNKPERLHLYKWIEGEEVYVANKFDSQRELHDQSMSSADGFEQWWVRQIVQYLDRAKQFLKAAEECVNLDDQAVLQYKAQQAIAKCMMTTKGCAESSIRVYGTLPQPGVTSGEIHEWID